MGRVLNVCTRQRNVDSVEVRVSRKIGFRTTRSRSLRFAREAALRVDQICVRAQAHRETSPKSSGEDKMRRARERKMTGSRGDSTATNPREIIPLREREMCSDQMRGGKLAFVMSAPEWTTRPAKLAGHEERPCLAPS